MHSSYFPLKRWGPVLLMRLGTFGSARCHGSVTSYLLLLLGFGYVFSVVQTKEGYVRESECDAAQHIQVPVMIKKTKQCSVGWWMRLGNWIRATTAQGYRMVPWFGLVARAWRPDGWIPALYLKEQVEPVHEVIDAHSFGALSFLFQTFEHR